MSDSTQSNTALASLLEGRLMEWERARKPQELKLLDCYQDVMRIPRDNDTKGSGAAKAGKTAGLFIGSTRNKVRAARAKINDALFGNGLLPFDTTPTNEELAPFADAVEEIVTEQLERMDFRHLLKTGVDTLATYGTAFLFGPFVRKETLTETAADNSAGVLAIKESTYEFDAPYYELGNTLDVYPDPEARRLCDGLGTFWTTMESPHTVAAWKADKSYSGIDQALNGAGDRGNETGGEIAHQLRGNVEFWHKNGRIKVARYFGKVPRSALAAGDAQPDDTKAGELVNVVAIMAGGVVVKVNESPYGERKHPVFDCQYEEVPHEIWGVGVAENNAPHQKVTNAAFRLFMEGKGMALLGTKSVDRSMFMPTEDFKKYPGKSYQFKPGLSPEQKKTAIIEHIEPDITNGWRDVIAMSEQFSDDDTGITKYTQGDDARNLNKTATGISMIMSASSLPIKEVIQHIDANWIEPMVEAVIEWDLKYLTVETVEKLHGKEIAQLWGQILQFGKTSFMDWQATGTSSFMQKEVLTNKLRSFADFALSNPLTAQKVDVTELLQQTWDVMQIGKESPVLKPEKGQALPPEVQQQMQQMQQHTQMLEDSLKEIGEKYNELHGKALADAEVRRIQAYDAHTRRLAVIKESLTPQLSAQLADEVGLDVQSEDDLRPEPEPVPQQGQPEPAQAAPEPAPEPEPQPMEQAPTDAPEPQAAPSPMGPQA